MKKKDLMSILITKNNDCFRASEDKDSPSYIFDPQIDTARKVVMRIASNSTRSNHVILTAHMQGGKSGCCNAVVNVINKSRLTKNMVVKKFFFITGMNDCGLKEQTYNRVLEQIMDANRTNTCFKKRDINNEGIKYYVLKNSDLMAYEGSLNESLIFIDECHYGSGERNVLTKFFSKHGIDWKNTNDLIKNNVYIVSVSATPFDEIVSDTAECKDVIELHTTDEYVGVSTYIENETIFQAEKDDIKEDGAIFDYIMDAHTRMIENHEDGIIFIRTRKFNVIKENGYVMSNFNIFEMSSNGSRLAYDELNNSMNEILVSNETKMAMEALGFKTNVKPLIVLIKGAFRAGITIPPTIKDIIYMIYDYSVKSDTTAQAMLGRMCGYRKTLENINKTFFYLNKPFAEMYSRWEKDFSNRNLIPCDNTKMEWVENCYDGDDVEITSKSCGNFHINLSDEEVKRIYLSGKGKRNRTKIVSGYINELLETHGKKIDYDYIAEAHISGKNKYSKSSQEKRFDSFSEDSLVFLFRPDKIKQFKIDTNRDFLTKEDVGKRCISIVLDATVDDELNIGGNKRLLVYYVEVAQRKKVFNRKTQYKAHKDTFLE